MAGGGGGIVGTGRKIKEFGQMGSQKKAAMGNYQ